MKNLKKTIALLSAFVMAGTLLAGCGKDEDSSSSSKASGDVTTAADTEATEVAATRPEDTDKNLVIYAWNEDWKGQFEEYYLPSHPLPDGYTINWVVNPNQDNVYQNALDEAIGAQADVADADKIDMFLFEADYATKYVNSDASIAISDLGITEEDLANQYEYTKTIATDKSGVLKGVSWQATPGLFVYRRSFAKDVFGTDDPDKVQEQLSDWDKFDAAAKTVHDKTGGKTTMLAGFDDSYRTFSNNVSAPWVQDDKIVIDQAIWDWVDQTKTYTDNGYNQKASLWDATWQAGQTSAGTVFGYFYSTWGVNYTLLGNSLDKAIDDGGKAEVGNGIFGDWAVCEGPANYFWGGTWMAAATGGNTLGLVSDIMKAWTCDTEFMQKFSEGSLDYVNNKESIKNIAEGGYQSPFLGGQNHIAIFAELAEKIDLSNLSDYDQGCNENAQTAFRDYYNGTVSKEDAEKTFYQLVETRYPNLTH